MVASIYGILTMYPDTVLNSTHIYTFILTTTPFYISVGESRWGTGELG